MYQAPQRCWSAISASSLILPEVLACARMTELYIWGNKGIGRHTGTRGKFPRVLFLKLAREFAQALERPYHAITAQRIASHTLSSSRRRGPRDERGMRGVSGAPALLERYIGVESYSA
ncbi:hypothetical protein KL86PLE_100679 [uncultured Pleomorphomonas sp.]|uniref:Uncharacterized protein n=1 Tax=uncultured Pleomorphomonas sp. TaxID=442121 RepID=A0A212L580_9HYPH|nr:hypothetical protein KL86PLE_100679 [uncultured Pleomorphomonas sp.]